MWDPNTGQDDGLDGPPPSQGAPNPGTPGDPNAITRQQVLDAYYAWTGRTPDQISEEEIQGAMGHPGGIGALNTFMANSPEGKAYTARNRGGQQTPPPGPGAPPPGSYDWQAPPPAWDFGGWQGSAPGFTPPTYTPPPAFQEPDYEAALNEGGYLFERNEGTRAMEQAAAAKGVLNGGGTLKDINAWGQNYATTRVNDVRNRAKDTYMINYGTQYADPYKYAYQAALDSFLGRNSQWQTQGQVGQRQNETDWMHAYTPWNDTWNRRVAVDLS